MPFKPGFRISVSDALVLVIGATGSGWMAGVDGWLAVVIGFTVGHFFLFCNVFRLARPLELAWSVCFVALVASTLVRGRPGWPTSLGLTFVVSVSVVGVHLRSPAYHGVAWRHFNPRLAQWWKAHEGEHARR